MRVEEKIVRANKILQQMKTRKTAPVDCNVVDFRAKINRLAENLTPPDLTASIAMSHFKFASSEELALRFMLEYSIQRPYEKIALICLKNVDPEEVRFASHFFVMIGAITLSERETDYDFLKFIRENKSLIIVNPLLDPQARIAEKECVTSIMSSQHGIRRVDNIRDYTGFMNNAREILANSERIASVLTVDENRSSNNLRPFALFSAPVSPGAGVSSLPSVTFCFEEAYRSPTTSPLS